MENKAFMFMPAWITPLNALPAEERWNVVVSIVEYASAGTRSIVLSPAAEMAFAYISADIDRMKKNYLAVCEKRKAAAESRWAKDESKECKSMRRKPKADKLKTETKSETRSETETETMKTSSSPSSSTARVCVREDAGTDEPYDDEELLTRFFDLSNQRKLQALSLRHKLPIGILKDMAEEISTQWALSEKTHEDYQDAASHLMFALAEKVTRERKSGDLQLRLKSGQRNH